MTWQNPWAWSGLAVVALPVLIHLLGQGRARRRPFPTLRFFPTPRPLPTRRTRIHDLLLLVIRVAVLAVAVAALAQPRFITHAMRSTSNRALARAIIIDTSASMMRLTPGNQRAVVLAQQVAERLFDSTTMRTALLTGSPARTIAGAVAWLARQPARGEIAILSDFQAGTIDQRDLASVPANVGIRLIRVGIRPATGPIETHSRQGDQEVIASTAQTDAQTAIEWRSAGAGSVPPPGMFYALAGPDEATAATAAAQAARTAGTPLPLDSSRAIAIVYPGATERAGLLRRMAPLHTAWMVDVVARLRRDSLLAGEALLADRDRLVLLPATPAASVASASLIASATRALSLAPAPTELDPEYVADRTLAAWQRAPSATGNVVSSAADDRTDGRWLWLLALALLALETWLRRAPKDSTTAEIARDTAR
jgi:hypothetical protein